MTSALRFASESALLAALTSELVPVAVATAPARAWRVADGTLRVAPSKRMSSTQLKRLLQAGAGLEEEPEPGQSAVEVSCWAELLAPRPVDEPSELGSVLFVLSDEVALLSLAGEMLRLGCDRQQLRATNGTFLLRAVGPPYYTVARATDHVDGLRAFVSAGHTAQAAHARVFIELGFAHPLAEALHPADDTLLLIGGDGTFSLLQEGAASEWVDVYQRLDLRLPAVAKLSPQPLHRKLQVALTLRRAGLREAPTLWVVRENAEAQLDALVQTLTDDVVERLLFAVATDADGKSCALVKVRPGPKAPPELALRGQECAPLLQIANLFGPVDSLVEPPLRRDRLRTLLAPDADALHWIEAAPDGSFSVHALPERALSPLAEWVEYVIDRHAAELTPWVRGATFAFEEFESTGGEWGATPNDERTSGPDVDHDSDEPDDDEPDDDKRQPKRAKRKRSKSSTHQPPPAAKPEAAYEPIASYVAQPPTADALALTAVEQRFIELDEPADSPERQPLWVEMAELNTRLARRREAGLCWTRALWDAPGAEAAALAARWSATEGGDLATLLALTAPNRDQIRSVAALVTAGQIGRHGAAILHWLDRFDDDLDLRSLWLARLELSRSVGGDRLGLTRARDRVLAKLHRGLSFERDVPAFLRFVGDADSTVTARLVQGLDELRATFVQTKRTRSSVEAPAPLTNAYVDLLFAYGLGRLGQLERARAIAAGVTLDVTDAVHGFLLPAYRARIEQALENRPPETPLPADVAGRLNELDRLQRYKVDRLRQLSTVLEPQERLDPMGAFHRGEKDPRGAEFTTLRGQTDAVLLAAEVARLFDHATSRAAAPDERARLYDGLMDFFPQLPESQALAQLRTLTESLDGIAPLRQSQLYEEALMLAGHFENSALVKKIVARLTPLLAHLDVAHVGAAASTVTTTLRALRRVGLRQEAHGLLAALEGAAVGDDTSLVLARLHLASGHFYLGHTDRARTALDEALGKLQGEPSMTERLQLTRGLSRVVAHATPELAFEVLAQLTAGLPKITDSFNTNSHFCLSVIGFMESLILGYASDDLALGEAGRRWIDEDEYLIRRRVHRDLKANNS